MASERYLNLSEEDKYRRQKYGRKWQRNLSEEEENKKHKYAREGIGIFQKMKNES